MGDDHVRVWILFFECLFIRKNWKSEPARCFPSLLFLLVIYKLHIVLEQSRDERYHRNSIPDTMCSIPNTKLLSLRAPRNGQAYLRDWLAQGSNTTVKECLSHACAETHSKSMSSSWCLQSSYSQQHRQTLRQNSPLSEKQSSVSERKLRVGLTCVSTWLCCLASQPWPLAWSVCAFMSHLEKWWLTLPLGLFWENLTQRISNIPIMCS